MTRLNYLGSVLIAFALGGVGMWAMQGHYKPLMNHLLAELHTVHIGAVTPAVTSSSSSSQPSNPLSAQAAPGGMTGSQTQAPAGPAVGGTPLQAPFLQMRRMQRQMQQQMNQLFNRNGLFGMAPFGQNTQANQGGIFGRGGMFGNMGSLFSGSSNDMGTTITRGEDANSIYYKMHLGHNQDLSNVKVNVDHGYVSINAKLQNKSSHAFSASTVSERFPVPAGVDPNSAKISRQGDSIVIRFNKA